MSQATILIVEDEAIVAADLANKLEQMGYAVIGTATHSQEAVDLARKLRPQLVLMDILLEGTIDGIETAEVIRMQYDVPVVYLTAHSDPATLARAKSTDPFGYILKPFEKRELATQIELALYRHQTNRTLREQQAWLRVTLTSIGDAVISTDAGGNINFMNPVAEALTGWQTDEALGRPVTQVFSIVDELTGQALAGPVARVLDEGISVSLKTSAALTTKQGSRLPVASNAAPILDDAGNVIGTVLVFRDITERKEAEEAMRQLNENLEQLVTERTRLAESRARQLQALAVELIEAEESERQRLADLLHDDLQQILASAKMQLQTACESSEPEPMLVAVERLLQTSMDKSRTLSQEISPSVFNHAGLVVSIKTLVRQMKERFGLQVELDIGTNRHLESAPLKSLIFRAIQELLFNVVKHSGVKHASVGISDSGNRAVVTVSDRGRGFDPAILDSLSARRGLGLLSLRERISYMGGNLSIDSATGRGSRFTFSVPLRLTENERPSNAEPTADPQESL
jgi:PAS domain S-box-containing protein